MSVKRRFLVVIPNCDPLLSSVVEERDDSFVKYRAKMEKNGIQRKRIILCFT